MCRCLDFVIIAKSCCIIISGLSFIVAHSPVCAAARCLGAGLRCLLHHLGSGQVQRDPHAKRTCGEGHGRRRQRGEDVAPASRKERQKARGDYLQNATQEASCRSLVSSSASHNNWQQILRRSDGVATAQTLRRH